MILTSDEYKVVWKYKTPLNSDYLNILMSGTTPGLVTLPSIELRTESAVIGSFSAFVQPIDAQNNYIEGEIVKVQINVEKEIEGIIADTPTVAGVRGIGLRVIDTGNGTEVFIEPVMGADCLNYKGIFIATAYNDGDEFNCSVNGAEYSDLLLSHLGYDSSFWLSPASPRRNKDLSYYPTRWEFRSANDVVSYTIIQSAQDRNHRQEFINSKKIFVNIGGVTHFIENVPSYFDLPEIDGENEFTFINFYCDDVIDPTYQVPLSTVKLQIVRGSSYVSSINSKTRNIIPLVSVFFGNDNKYTCDNETLISPVKFFSKTNMEINENVLNII